MKGRRQQIGRQGEAIAAAHLASLGYTVIGRNFRCQRGEIDLIAQRHDHLCFVEVRSWPSGRFGEPEDWIPPWKRRRMALAAQVWMLEHEPAAAEITLGAIVIGWEGGRPQVTFYDNAAEA